jgi:hypothetical protein
MNKAKIRYKKVFVSGHLKGMSVDTYITVPVSEVERNLAALVKMDKRNPVKEACTRNKFYVTDISWSAA